ncbi:MAG TPA: alpha-galactosidase [Mycobacteriales bacterium]
MQFPSTSASGPTTGVVLTTADGGLPRIDWVGLLPDADRSAEQIEAAVPESQACALLPEHSRGWYGRPGLSGYRLGGDDPVAGRDWSTAFETTGLSDSGPRLRVEAEDRVAGLRLATDMETLPGGAIRTRHTLTNTAPGGYVVQALDVVFPLPRRAAETLDFTGGWGRERVPQRRPIADGLWVREGRRGKTGHDAATVLVAGTSDFGFGDGDVWGVHVGWSGNHVHRVERLPSGLTTIGGGELLLPGEVVLGPDESYTTPWVYLVAADDGLDGLAAAFHGFLRSLPAHPRNPRPVNLNVWEAVYFDHDLDRLLTLADLAAEVGVGRYVLDDGWFRYRRHDHAGLGDWWVDEAVWPKGLSPLIERVRERGMEFGLWFEPEMVNPDSDLYRAHPDWILSTGGRVPPLQRNQLVLDLSRSEVRDYLLERLDALLGEYDISYVKWDHNRDLIDAGSQTRAGGAVVHAHTLGFYALLDELRRRHPKVEWESCAGGGGRVDLGILERTERIWTSDMTDALARQAIQRWTGQLVPSEYMGAHISAPVSHQTGRAIPLAFRAATALFGQFGIEWDLTAATADERAELARWVALYREHQALVHTGRVVRVETSDDSALSHGVVAADRSSALMAWVQVDLADRGAARTMTVPGLDPGARYRVTQVGPRGPGAAAWPVDGAEFSGAVLATVGLPVPAARPLTIFLVALQQV